MPRISAHTTESVPQAPSQLTEFISSLQSAARLAPGSRAASAAVARVCHGCGRSRCPGRTHPAGPASHGTSCLFCGIG